VCVKQTPDSTSVYIDPISGKVDQERFVQVLNSADACAVEAAVRLKEQLGASVLALTLGPKDAEGALRAALAIGADRALRLWCSQATEWGPFTVAAALAACIRSDISTPDFILCGDSASDWSSGTVGPALAEYLNLPQITGVMQLNTVKEQAQNTVTLQVTRKLERGYRELLEAQPPLLLTVTSDLNEPRYPSLPAHLAALQASIPVLDPQTLPGNILDVRASAELAERVSIPSRPSPIYRPQEESEETTILEVHTPRPRPRRIPAPDSRHSAFERIGEIVSGGAIGRKTRLVEGTSEELAKVLVQFLREKGFL